MAKEERVLLIQLLLEHKDIFAWNHQDMPGIGEEVIEHRLNISLDAGPFNHKKRNFSIEKYKVMAENMNQLLAVGFYQGNSVP